MATILEFRSEYAKSGEAHVRRPHETTAEIVIFPGVRYERWVEEVSEPKRNRRSRQRDRLDLDD